MHPSVPQKWQPLLFENGQVIPFPAPTKDVFNRCLKKAVAATMNGYLKFLGDIL